MGIPPRMDTRRRPGRHFPALLSALVVAAVALAGCQTSASQQKKESGPSTTLNPLGPNSYAPTVKAPGPQTALPGNVNTG